MSNPGNTGQHYKLSKVTSVDLAFPVITTTLECNHTYTTEVTLNNVDWTLEYKRRRLGKREKCNQCNVPVGRQIEEK